MIISFFVCSGVIVMWILSFLSCLQFLIMKFPYMLISVVGFCKCIVLWFECSFIFIFLFLFFGL
jgi:hypothetical protein